MSIIFIIQYYIIKIQCYIISKAKHTHKKNEQWIWIKITNKLTFYFQCSTPNRRTTNEETSNKYENHLPFQNTFSGSDTCNITNYYLMMVSPSLYSTGRSLPASKCSDPCSTPVSVMWHYSTSNFPQQLSRLNTELQWGWGLMIIKWDHKNAN